MKRKKPRLTMRQKRILARQNDDAVTKYSVRFIHAVEAAGGDASPYKQMLAAEDGLGDFPPDGCWITSIKYDAAIAAMKQYIKSEAENAAMANGAALGADATRRRSLGGRKCAKKRTESDETALQRGRKMAAGLRKWKRENPGEKKLVGYRTVAEQYGNISPDSVRRLIRNARRPR